MLISREFKSSPIPKHQAKNAIMSFVEVRGQATGATDLLTLPLSAGRFDGAGSRVSSSLRDALEPGPKPSDKPQ